MFRQSKQLRSHSRLRAHAVFIMVTNFVLSVRSVRRRRLCHAPLADGPPSLEAPWLCPCSSLYSQRPEKTTCPPFGAYASGSVSSCRLQCFTSVCGCSRRRCEWSPAGVTWLPRLTADWSTASGREPSRVSMLLLLSTPQFTQCTGRVPYGLVIKRYWKPLIGTCGAWYVAYTDAGLAHH